MAQYVQVLCQSLRHAIRSRFQPDFDVTVLLSVVSNLSLITTSRRSRAGNLCTIAKGLIMRLSVLCSRLTRFFLL